MIKVLPNIAAMARYAPPWTGLDRKNYMRLDLNENTQPPPEQVKIALDRLIDAQCIQMYPEYDFFMPKLSSYVGIEQDYLMVTNGSDQGIEIILRAFLAPNDSMIIARPEFPIFGQIAGVIGASIHEILFPVDLTFPYESFDKGINPNTKLITIINPNNPTGTEVSLEFIKYILEKYQQIPVIVDEAYYEFTGTTALDLLKEHHNLIISRTFSKAFAMAGLRLGYIIAHPDIISQFYKIRGPFDVNICAVVAAEAQIDYPDTWRQHVYETMKVSKPSLEDYFDAYGVRYYKGGAHFMLVQPRHRDQAVQYLKSKGILVRPMIAPLIKNMFRMSVGTPEETQIFMDIYRSFLEEIDHQ